MSQKTKTVSAIFLCSVLFLQMHLGVVLTQSESQNALVLFINLISSQLALFTPRPYWMACQQQDLLLAVCRRDVTG